MKIDNNHNAKQQLSSQITEQQFHNFQIRITLYHQRKDHEQNGKQYRIRPLIAKLRLPSDRSYWSQLPSCPLAMGF